LTPRFRILRPIDEPTALAAPTNGNAPVTSPAQGAPAPAPPGQARAGAAPPAAPAEDPELLARRDQLLEKFTIMQADLGGAFYEMAIRDHVRMDVLTRKAAELQRVDAELSEIERMLELARTGAAGNCPTCQAPYGPGSAFCSQCGHPLASIQRA
jgi:hypothetical protein